RALFQLQRKLGVGQITRRLPSLERQPNRKPVNLVPEIPECLILGLLHGGWHGPQLAHEPTDQELLDRDRPVLLEGQTDLQKIRSPNLVTGRTAATALSAQREIFHELVNDRLLSWAGLLLDDWPQELVVERPSRPTRNRTSVRSAGRSVQFDHVVTERLTRGGVGDESQVLDPFEQMRHVDQR